VAAQRTLNVSVILPLVVGLLLVASAALWQRSGIDETEPRDLRAECDAGQAKSCFELGMKFGSGDGQAQDQARAYELVDRACSLGSEEACEFLPMMKAPGSPQVPGAP
jgi:TPR repeat protein